MKKDVPNTWKEVLDADYDISYSFGAITHDILKVIQLVHMLGLDTESQELKPCLGQFQSAAPEVHPELYLLYKRSLRQRKETTSVPLRPTEIQAALAKNPKQAYILADRFPLPMHLFDKEGNNKAHLGKRKG